MALNIYILDFQLLDV